MKNVKKLLCVILAVSMVLSLLPVTVLADDPDITADFTDANFLKAVRSVLGIGTSDPVYFSDVSGVTSLVVYGKNIQSLAGIESFTALQQLDCGGNQLTSLPANLPSTLQNLSCGNNQLTSLPVLPTSLQTLSCSNNQLTVLPVLPDGLQMLTCNSNQLTVLPTLPSGLQYLFCYGNQLTALPTLPSGLQGLSCSNNRLTALPALPSGLGLIYCDHNRLTGLDVTGLNVLEVLGCNYNYMTGVSSVTGYSSATTTDFTFAPQYFDITVKPAIYNVAIVQTGSSTGYGYPTLTAALAAAEDGNTVTLLNDITESVTYTASVDKTITIDGNNFSITGTETTPSALTLIGAGLVKLKNLTLKGGDSSTQTSSGLAISGSVNVCSYGTVTALGGLANTSYGLVNNGSGTVDVTEANGNGTQLGIGVNNTGTGTVNAGTATGMYSLNGYGIGVANTAGGTVNVTTAIARSVGVSNTGSGTVNVITAKSINAHNFIGVRNDKAGTINAGAAIAASASDSGALNLSSGTVNVGTITGLSTNQSTGKINTGADVTTLTLIKGTGTSCVLNSITIAKTDTQIGKLPNVYKGEQYSGSWCSDRAVSQQFTTPIVSGVATLYSSFYTETKISTAAIAGVSVPVTGQTPVSTIADTTEYTASISWSPNDSVFKEGTIYTATITITPKEGYTLSGVEEGFFKVAGVTTTNVAGSGVITAIFPATAVTPSTLAGTIMAAASGLTAVADGSTVTVTGTATVTTTSDAALTFAIPLGVKVVWKASLSGGGNKYLLVPTGDGIFEVADGANIVNNACQTAIHCNVGKGKLIITGGKVSTTGSGVAINIAGGWLLTMTGGEVAANADNSFAILSKNSAVIAGGTVSATGEDGYQLYMGETSVYRSGVLDPGKITYNAKEVFVEVCLDAVVTQAQPGTSTSLTVTGHNLSTGDSVAAVWAKQDGQSGVNISYYSAEANAKSGTTEALETWFLAVPVETVTTTYTVTFNKNGGDTEASPATKAVASGTSVSTLPTEPARSGYTFVGWNTAADGSGTAFTAPVIVISDITVYAQWSKNSSAGNGGVSNGSTTTTNPAATNPTTTVSGSTAITTVTPTVSGGKASGAVTAAQISDALAKVKAAAGKDEVPKMKIEVGGASGASSVGTTIPLSSIQVLVNGGVGALTISGPIGSVTFDAAALSTISGKASGDVTITASKVDASTLSDVAKQAVGNHPVYQFSVTCGGNTISQFGGTVKLSIPYTPTADEDINGIIVYYIKADGSLETVTNGHYDAATGTVVFTTDHFSTYAVSYNKVSFSDVNDTAWYADAVTFLAARGVTSGTTATNFSPDATLTRGQFITMLLRAYSISADVNPKDNFADAGNTYYTNYLAAAKRLGISGGVGNNLFAPEKEITRQEMFTLLYNALKVIDMLPEITSVKALSDFSDTGDIASWAKDAMTLFVKTGTVTGNSGKLSPTDTTTRAEMVQVLYRLLIK